MNNYTRCVIWSLLVCFLISIVSSRVENSPVPGRGPKGSSDGDEPTGVKVQDEKPGDGPTETPVDPEPAENNSPPKKKQGILSGAIGALGL